MAEKDRFMPSYEAGYAQGRFDVLFDLRHFLYGDFIVNMSTGEKDDPINPDNRMVFEDLGLSRGMLNLKRRRDNGASGNDH